MRSEKNIIFLVNPISGTRNKATLRRLIEREAVKQFHTCQILETSADGNYSSILEKIDREGITDVIICGGDGTVNQVISGLKNAKVNFGIVPMGSGNGLAFAAGIPYSTKKALTIALTAPSSLIDAYTVNGRFSCMLSGVGIDALIAHDFVGVKKRGLVTYLKKSLRQYFLAKPFPFTVEIGDFSFKTEAYFISVANSNQFGNYVTIAPKASLSDGLLDVVVVNRMNKIALLYQIARQVKSGRVMQPGEVKASTGISYFQTKSVTIRNPLRAPLHIDGEPAATSEIINIQIIENAFRLIRP